MVKASIDLGTNTCLLLIAELASDVNQIKKIIRDESRVVRLGKGVDKNHSFTDAGKERALNCLKEFSEILKKEGVEVSNVRCVATAQARDAKDGQDFLDTIWNETRLKFEILSGQDEAQLSFNGALLQGMVPAQTAVIDVGGGSTELMSKMGGLSLGMGAVRFTERYLLSDPVLDEEFWNCEKHINEELEALKPWRETLSEGIKLVAVAGTATNLAAWMHGLEMFDRDIIDRTELSSGDVHRMVEELKWRSIQERKKIKGIDSKRADVILAGALILWRALEVLSFDRCVVSTRGLRYGILFRQ